MARDRSGWSSRADPGPSAQAATCARSPLGRPDEAILVRPIGASWTTPDSLEVTLSTLPTSHPTSSPRSRVRSCPPANGSRRMRSRRQRDRWLAIPIQAWTGRHGHRGGVVFVDLLDPTAPPQSIVGPSSGSWNGDMFAADQRRWRAGLRSATGYLGSRRSPIPPSRLAHDQERRASIRLDDCSEQPFPGTTRHRRMGRGQRRWLVQRDDGPPAGLSTDRARATRLERTPIAS